MFVASLTPLYRVDAVIEVLGGNNVVAELTSTPLHPVRNKTVWSWRALNSFPAKTYVVLSLALMRAGYCAPVALWGMIDPTETVHSGPTFHPAS